MQHCHLGRFFNKPDNHIPQRDCLPLTMATPGEWLRLVKITAGNGLRHRLTEMGLIPGVEFQVVQSEGGPLVLAVHDSRLAVGRGTAHKIMVKILEHECG